MRLLLTLLLSAAAFAQQAAPPSSLFAMFDQRFDGPAELPRAWVDSSSASTPAPGRQVQVPSGGLQAALNSASCGDRLLLAPGSVHSGTFTLPAKPCDDSHWIWIMTSGSMPAEGSRTSPCLSGVSSLPGRPQYPCSSTSQQAASISEPQGNTSGPIVLAPGANHYRLMGLEVTRTPGTPIIFQLIGASAAADHIVLDRVWLHGSAQDETKTGVNLAGITYFAMVDSYATDFHCTSSVGSCTDAKVIGGGNSNLPGGLYKIDNNFLEASGENILFGGGSATTTPHDVEIRFNHFFKPLTWLVGQPGFVGGPGGQPFMVKNLLEFKNVLRALVEGNIFEHSWGGYSQNGYMVLLTPKNQAGGCPICIVDDVTFRYNIMAHAGAGFSFANVPDDGGQVATDGERWSIHDVLVTDIDKTKYTGGSGVLFLVVSSWPASGQISHLHINHVTAFPDPQSKIFTISSNVSYPKMADFAPMNSILGGALYPVWTSSGNATDCSISTVPITVLGTCFASYVFSNNAIIGINQANYPPSKWPAGNFFPASAAAVGFVNYNQVSGGDFHLSSSSPYHGKATDGKDLGADIDMINLMTKGVY